MNLWEDGAPWPLLTAMEYQRVYYEALPEKIAGASRTTMDGIAAAAEREAAAAQARLTDSVAQEAQNVALEIQYGRLTPMRLLALSCLLAYGSLMLWAGFHIDAGRDMPLAAILHMPPAGSSAGCVSQGERFVAFCPQRALLKRKKVGLTACSCGRRTVRYLCACDLLIISICLSLCVVAMRRAQQRRTNIPYPTATLHMSVVPDNRPTNMFGMAAPL